MTSEEIQLALRLIAMGRPAHDECKRLADFLAAKPAEVVPVAAPAAEAVEAKPKRIKKAD